MKRASKSQLIHIALKEDCPLELKYAAARELQFRRKRKIAGQVDQTWWSMHLQIKNDMERLRHKILQLRDEMVSSGASEAEARRYLDKRTIDWLNRRVQQRGTTAGKARKHVKRKAAPA